MLDNSTQEALITRFRSHYISLSQCMKAKGSSSPCLNAAERAEGVMSGKKILKVLGAWSPYDQAGVENAEGVLQDEWPWYEKHFCKCGSGDCINHR
ncbi:hypothetical protein [Neptuniibacter sp. QD34_54]|uniref:hypothetical protein n=1 Tax=Neptuniibacter sp. QD34_54 TaxID=3398208 RepID=UPI0039F48E71